MQVGAKQVKGSVGVGRKKRHTKPAAKDADEANDRNKSSSSAKEINNSKASRKKPETGDPAKAVPTSRPQNAVAAKEESKQPSDKPQIVAQIPRDGRKTGTKAPFEKRKYCLSFEVGRLVRLIFAFGVSLRLQTCGVSPAYFSIC